MWAGLGLWKNREQRPGPRLLTSSEFLPHENVSPGCQTFSFSKVIEKKEVLCEISQNFSLFSKKTMWADEMLDNFCFAAFILQVAFLS
jgi:hypothetical protein